MSKYAFGVDIGGTTVKMGLFDKDGWIMRVRLSFLMLLRAFVPKWLKRVFR